jgi:RIO kinase 1
VRDTPHSYEYSRERRRGKWRFDDDEPRFQKRQGPARTLPTLEEIDETDGLPEGDRWSTWDRAENLDR